MHLYIPIPRQNTKRFIYCLLLKKIWHTCKPITISTIFAALIYFTCKTLVAVISFIFQPFNSISYVYQPVWRAIILSNNNNALILDHLTTQKSSEWCQWFEGRFISAKVEGERKPWWAERPTPHSLWMLPKPYSYFSQFCRSQDVPR